MTEKWRKPVKVHRHDRTLDLVRYFDGITAVDFNQDCYATLNRAEPSEYGGPKLVEQQHLILKAVAAALPDRRALRREEWAQVLNHDSPGSAWATCSPGTTPGCIDYP